MLASRLVGSLGHLAIIGAGHTGHWLRAMGRHIVINVRWESIIGTREGTLSFKRNFFNFQSDLVAVMDDLSGMIPVTFLSGRGRRDETSAHTPRLTAEARFKPIASCPSRTCIDR